MNERNCLCNVFDLDGTTWILLLVAAYFLLGNGGLDQIFSQVDTTTLLLLGLLALFLYNNHKERVLLS